MTDGRATVDQRVRRTELLISRMLRIGVLTSLSLVVAGTVLTFARNPSYLSDRRAVDTLTAPTATFPHTPGDVVTGLGHLQGDALVTLGLLVLIATPVLRVAVSIAGFAHQRDRTFVVITSVVLGLLLLSFALGRAAA